MYLEKVYYSLPRDLLIEKLAAYGLDISSLNLFYSYLNNSYQRAKIGSLGSTARKSKNWGPKRIATRAPAA